VEFRYTGRDEPPTRRDVVLVNRERIGRAQALAAVATEGQEQPPSGGAV
jgi:hypothetical protein